MPKSRTELQREVTEALVSSKAVNFEAIGEVLGKFGARAVLAGDALWLRIGHNCLDICIPPVTLPGLLGGGKVIVPSSGVVGEEE